MDFVITSDFFSQISRSLAFTHQHDISIHGCPKYSQKAWEIMYSAC